MQTAIATAVVTSMFLGYDGREQILAAVLANENALATFSCRVTTEVTGGKGGGYTAQGFVIRRPNYHRFLSQSPKGQIDYEIDGDSVRMMMNSDLQIRPRNDMDSPTSDTDWFFLTRQRVWGPNGIQFLSDLIRSSGDKLTFGESKEGPTISFPVLDGKCKCLLTLSWHHNLLPKRLTWTNRLVHERKTILEEGSFEVLEYQEELPGIFVPTKVTDVTMHNGVVIVRRTSSAEKISLVEKDQQRYPPFRFPSNTMIMDSVRREVYQLREDGTRVPVFRNGREVKGLWYRQESDEAKSPAMLKIQALSARIPSEFSPWPWFAGGLAVLAGLGAACWYWRRRTEAES